MACALFQINDFTLLITESQLGIRTIAKLGFVHFLSLRKTNWIVFFRLTLDLGKLPRIGSENAAN